MKSALYTFVTILLISYQVRGYSQENYGLTFQSFEVRQEKRTSLKIGDTSPLCLKGNMDFSFDFYFLPDRQIYFGYLFRMINHSGQNIDLVYNQKDQIFNTIAGDSFSGINFPIDAKTLFNKWTHIRYHFSKDSIICYINERKFRSAPIRLKDHCFKIIFGACNYKDFSTTDVPPMVIRNIALGQTGHPVYFWPLREAGNTSLKDSISGAQAIVSNPAWSEDLHKNWQLLKSINVKGFASYAFNGDLQELNVVSEDSVYRIYSGNSVSAVYAYPTKNYHLFNGDQSMYNTVDHKLYNFYIDIKSIASYSDQNDQWSKHYDTVEVTEYTHANRVFLKNQNALYILGGYGQLTYKNKIQRYDFVHHHWEELKVTGDYFTPRYLAAAGHIGDSIYILGGYGSHSGDQVLKPQHLYDLLLFNARTRTIKKLYTLEEPKTAFTFAGAMVIDSIHHCYYALNFDNSKFDSRLQLIQGSLTRPQYTNLGSTIPYSFRDVLSDADLFYCRQSRQLLAVTSILDENRKQTNIRVYSIAFPPISAMTAALPDNGWFSSYRIGLLFLLVLCVGLATFAIFKRKRRGHLTYLSRSGGRKQGPGTAAAVSLPLATAFPEEDIYTNHELTTYDKKITLTPPPFISDREPMIQLYLFGTFEIIDAHGNALSHEFSPLLKELFLVILLYTIRNKKGISSDKLNDIFWRDKTGKNARNNQAVNIVRLRGILSKIGGISIKKAGECWNCEYQQEDVSIDLLDYEILDKEPYEHGRRYLAHLLYFVSRGAFLKQTECLWLDNIKAEISNKVIDKLLTECKFLDPHTDLMYMVETANCIFNFDPLNEDALYLKCKSLNHLKRPLNAQKTFERFKKEYTKTYGEEFPESYSSFLNK